MADFRDQVYDRIHHVARSLVKTTDPKNPERSPSTRKLVSDQVKPKVCELEVLVALLEVMN